VVRRRISIEDEYHLGGRRGHLGRPKGNSEGGGKADRLIPHLGISQRGSVWGLSLLRAGTDYFSFLKSLVKYGGGNTGAHRGPL